MMPLQELQLPLCLLLAMLVVSDTLNLYLLDTTLPHLFNRNGHRVAAENGDGSGG